MTKADDHELDLVRSILLMVCAVPMLAYGFKLGEVAPFSLGGLTTALAAYCWRCFWKHTILLKSGRKPWE